MNRKTNMKQRNLISLVFATIFSLFCLPGFSQDIHFTLYEMAPFTLTPANTGRFLGSVRVGGIYRDQYSSIIGIPNEYKTPMIYADSPILKGFGENDWLGVGITMYQDKAGTLGLTNASVKLSAGYHMGLGKKANSVLSIGYQTGSVQFRVKDKFKAIFEDSFGGGQSLDLQNIKDDNVNYLEHAGGIHLTSRIDNLNTFKLGVSVAHIGNQRASLLTSGGGINRIEMRYVAHAGWRNQFNSRIAIEPTVFYQKYSTGSELLIHGNVHYLLNAEKGMVVHGGIGYRVGDAAQLMFGLGIKDLKVMLGYDINVSDLSGASSSFGGFELALSYIAKIYKRPDPKPAVFCPRF
jgi:type IX secretion system PorP/SprF family membrane protein